MKRSATSCVLIRYAHLALFVKEVQRRRLISLSSNVKNIKPKLVLGFDVCSEVEQSLSNFNVSLEGSIMEGREHVFKGFLIHPVTNNNGEIILI